MMCPDLKVQIPQPSAKIGRKRKRILVGFNLLLSSFVSSRPWRRPCKAGGIEAAGEAYHKPSGTRASLEQIADAHRIGCPFRSIPCTNRRGIAEFQPPGRSEERRVGK